MFPSCLFMYGRLALTEERERGAIRSDLARLCELRTAFRSPTGLTSDRYDYLDYRGEP